MLLTIRTQSVHTVLETDHQSNQPFPTATPSVTGAVPSASTDYKPGITTPTVAISSNVFVPIATNAPPPQVSSRSDHPVPTLGIVNQTGPIETNKFYANMFLGSQSHGAWTHPYSMWWSKGAGNPPTWGMSISHVERKQITYGPGSPAEYFVAPIGIQSITMSAKELDTDTCLTIDTPTAFSVNVNLSPSNTSTPIVSFPLVQGMGFVTGVYTGATLQIDSLVQFTNLTYVDSLEGGQTYKYRAALNDDTTWLLYLTPTGSTGAPPLNLTSSDRITGPSGYNGLVQVAKNPNGSDGEATYDAAAGAYAESGTISGSVDGTQGTYTLNWKKGGIQSQKLLMFTLPHHQSTFDNSTANALTTLELMTTTKGMAKAVLGDYITMTEQDLPVDMGFAPFGDNNVDTAGPLSDAVKKSIVGVATQEIAENMTAQCLLDSMYYSGKGFAKFAAMIFTIKDMALDDDLAAAGLQNLEALFDVFISNNQQVPLVYDTVWKGAVSSGTYTSPTHDGGVDFGNSLYNDHHFHYGYFVYTAAVIAYLDSSWLGKGTNRAWVEMLIRDYANPTSDDPYYPFSRSFDWFHGHSWATGLFESADGKNEESTSEDVFASYAIKMWGRVTGDANMEARGNLMLAVQRTSLQHYFLYESDNTVQPPEFIGNKVSGIVSTFSLFCDAS
jgi:endo-1,3(4)-beta-glucanase